MSMKVTVTFDIDDQTRRGLNAYFAQDGMATREELEAEIHNIVDVYLAPMRAYPLPSEEQGAKE